ncbi:SDR family NAD(P)-dependent oxidoreductase [Ilumatobacter coccineus]|uniref:Putative oxidoreductase n=1 Tax=Ilumatobacter coccineus (strain NBRC 103263 / KCTC 29153 / YM16-304) TaxID=1313172 RepID=A0A6C7ECC3_ILUCY|nr:SDR family NAD(P)-dependent oxidoreductase [Ilumatobacter coccineus]BAN02785.1 putative oxidoreductase [Ilumatobacter coccineus YM16-304]
MTRLSELSRSIDGKVAIVTGAASGMGRATAHLFADEGARVVVADLGGERVQAVVDEIVAVHGADAALGVVTDVSSHDQLERLVDATVEWAGALDIIVNNAGVSLINSAFQPHDEFEENWARTLDINLTAHARLIRLALPHLSASGAGRIVNIASTEAIVTTARLAAYAATKAGVVGLTKSFAVELGRHGVTVNCVCPGPINTGMTEQIDAEAKATYARRRVPLRRYGAPEEVAQMTLNLCLPASSFVNGAIIPVDGGMSIRHT